MATTTLEHDEIGAAALASWDEAWTWWRPRPDQPELFDQQTGFVESRNLVTFLFGGNGAGKTACAAYKAAQFLMDTKPPRPDTPFWIVGQSYVQVCSVCWAEKLWGQGFLPRAMVDYDRIVWLKPTMNWPLMVPLVTNELGSNWVLEFKTFEQGRKAMQARSIGGAWFSEQVDWGIFLEVLRGCRDYMYPGSVFAECTPIEPELCIQMEKYLDDPPEDWGFFRANTDCNTAVSEDWKKAFKAATPDEMLATRLTGALATFEGVIYQSFNPSIHGDGDDSCVRRSGMTHHRATDWGASAEHPFGCVWGCYDATGEWTIYDELWSTSQDAITQDHAAEVLARSIAWGWPEPDFFDKPDPARAFFVQKVKKRVEVLNPDRFVNCLRKEQRREGLVLGSHYQENFADPSRPGEMNAFNYWGIPTSSASNEVYKGIDLVRARLKVNPMTGKAQLYFHKRCQHAIEEMRKYRWVKTRPNGLWTTAAPRPVPLKKSDDIADCVRYALASVERGRGLAPSSADSRIDKTRDSLLFARTGNGHAHKPMEAARQGFFTKGGR